MTLSDKGMLLVIRVLLVSTLIPAFQEENKLGVLKCFSMVSLKVKSVQFVFLKMFQCGLSNVGITSGFSKCQ